MKSQKNISINETKIPFLCSIFKLPYKIILEVQIEWSAMKENAIIMV